MWSDHFPINRYLNYHIYPFYFSWKVFRGCISMTSLLKDLHLKGRCSNLIHIWHNVFSCRILLKISFQQALFYIPLITSLFTMGMYILNKFLVCCESEKKLENICILYLVPFWFLTSIFLSSPWRVLSTGAWRTVSLGFLGFPGASASINLKEHCALLMESHDQFLSLALCSSPVRVTLYEITPHVPIFCFAHQTPAALSEN